MRWKCAILRDNERAWEMGIFGGDSISDLAKELLVCRLETSSDAMGRNFGRRDVDRLSSTQVMGLPETTIAKILETIYANLSNPDIIQLIERHRRVIGAMAEPLPESIDDYILQRVELEHPGAVSEHHVNLCVAACHSFFGIASSSGKAALSVETVRRHQAERDLHSTWSAIIDRFVNGGATDGEFLERTNELYERISPIVEREQQKQTNVRFQQGLDNLDD